MIMSLLLSENKLGVHLAERTNGNVGVSDGKWLWKKDGESFVQERAVKQV